MLVRGNGKLAQLLLVDGRQAAANDVLAHVVARQVDGDPHQQRFGMTLGILGLMPLWDKRNQSVYDKVSSTVVVSES